MAIAALVEPGAPQGAQSASFGYTGDLQYCTWPTTEIDDITAFGAQGGYSLFVSAPEGGQGAEIGGDVVLTKGQQLTILVASQEKRRAAPEVAAAEPSSCSAPPLW